MKFIKVFWAAFLGCVISGVIGFVLWIVVIVSMVGSLGAVSTVIVEPNSILRIELSETFTDAPVSDPFSQIDFMTMDLKPSISLLAALTAIEAAAEDDNIAGIYLNISPMMALSSATIEELRTAIELFKESGKFVVAYNDTYTQGGYYLSTIADKVYVQPEGMILWKGMATNTMFFKGLLDKLDISVDVFRPTACRYKSAVEPFIMDKMSTENRAQMQTLINSMWSTVAGDVALDRGLTLEQVNEVADNLDCFDVDAALEARMVDGLIYEDQLRDAFCSEGYKIDEGDQINYINFADYIALNGKPLHSFGAPKVAIIYAEGSIVDGEGSDAKVYGATTAQIIRDARLDESIEAVVLRVNSPGGSALASDVMWRELELLRQEKPLVVSMGGYAASGGYYISAPADIIVANRLTLTGSIGVFGLIPNIESGLKNKLGVTFDGVKTNSSADFMSRSRTLTPAERKVMLKSVDKVYTQFTTLVSEGRNLPLSDVLEIAQGRVWSGTEAVELGLADNIGGLRSAIALAVTKAGISENFRIVELLGEPTGLAAIISGLEASIKAAIKQNPLQGHYEEIQSTLDLLDTQHGLLMYSPYSVGL